MILLPTPIAKLVIKDLIKYNGLQTELIIKDKIIAKKDSVIQTDSITNKKKDQIILNLNILLKDSKKQLNDQQKITKYYEDALKKQKQTTWFVGGACIGVGILIKLLFIK